MAYKSADNLNRHKERGSKLTHDEWNAVARAVGADKIAPHSHGDEATFAIARKVQDRRWFYAGCGQVVPPYSALCIRTAVTSSSNPPDNLPQPVFPSVRLYESDTAGNLGTEKASVIVTNGAEPFDFNLVGGDRLINIHVVDDIPCLLRVASGASAIFTDLKPLAGGYAGFHFASGSAATGKVCRGKTGLLAVSDPFQSASMPDPAEWYQWFVASRGPVAVIGTTTNTITAANRATRTLGNGRMLRHSRADDGAILNTGSLDKDDRVWSMAEHTIPVNSWVIALDVIPVGLVITKWFPVTPQSVCTQIGPFLMPSGTSYANAYIKLCIHNETGEYTFQRVDASGNPI